KRVADLSYAGMRKPVGLCSRSRSNCPKSRCPRRGLGGIAARRKRSGKPPERQSLSARRAAEPRERSFKILSLLRGPGRWIKRTKNKKGPGGPRENGWTNQLERNKGPGEPRETGWTNQLERKMGPEAGPERGFALGNQY